MAADDVALAWVRMHDEGVRDRVQAGDLDPLGELSLTDEEQDLVRRLASELEAPAEVQTFQTSALFEAMNYGWGKLSPEVLEEVSARLQTDEEEAEVQGYGNWSFAGSPPAVSTGLRRVDAGDPSASSICSTHCSWQQHQAWSTCLY